MYAGFASPYSSFNWGSFPEQTFLINYQFSEIRSRPRFTAECSVTNASALSERLGEGKKKIHIKPGIGCGRKSYFAGNGNYSIALGERRGGVAPGERMQLFALRAQSSNAQRTVKNVPRATGRSIDDCATEIGSLSVNAGERPENFLYRRVKRARTLASRPRPLALGSTDDLATSTSPRNFQN